MQPPLAALAGVMKALLQHVREVVAHHLEQVPRDLVGSQHQLGELAEEVCRRLARIACGQIANDLVDESIIGGRGRGCGGFFVRPLLLGRSVVLIIVTRRSRWSAGCVGFLEDGLLLGGWRCGCLWRLLLIMRLLTGILLLVLIMHLMMLLLLLR